MRHAVRAGMLAIQTLLLVGCTEDTVDGKATVDVPATVAVPGPDGSPSPSPSTVRCHLLEIDHGADGEELYRCVSPAEWNRNHVGDTYIPVDADPAPGGVNVGD